MPVTADSGGSTNSDQAPPVYRRWMFWSALELLYLLIALHVAGSAPTLSRLAQALWLAAALGGYLALQWARHYYELTILAPPSRTVRARRATRSARVTAGLLCLLVACTLLVAASRRGDVVDAVGILAVLGLGIMSLPRGPTLDQVLDATAIPLDQPWRGLLLPVLWAHQMPWVELCRIDQGPSCSAATALYVCFRKRHVIALTGPLLELLGPDELRAVFAHEVAHVKGHHSRQLRRLYQGCLAVTAALAFAAAVHDLPRSMLVWPIVTILGHRILMMPAGLAIAALSQRSEIIATWGALEITQDPAAMRSAVLKLARHNHIGHHRPSWLARLWRPVPVLEGVLALIDKWEQQHPGARPVVFEMPVPPPLPPGPVAP